MTTDIDIFRTRGVDVATDEKARRAVKVFRNLQPTLTAYARNLTGRKDVVVEMAARDNGSTDGKKIYYRPPIALGEEKRHERRLCDKRDPATRELLCEACSVREEVLVTIYHEIAHLTFDSFQQVTPADFLLTMEKAIEEVGTKYAKEIKKALDNAPRRIKDSYIGISNYVSPFLPFLVNCLEDARVNAEMFKARPGTKVMFDTSTAKIFRDGVEQVDRATGEVIVKPWAEYPLNAQATIGTFCIASGYDFRGKGWFAPQIEDALADEKLNQLCRSIDTVRSAAGVYSLSFPVLARLRELGYCKSDRDPEDEEEQDESENGIGPEDEDSGDSEPSNEDGSGDADSEADSQEEDTDASEDAGSSGDDPQESGSEGDSGEADDPGADSAPEAESGDAGTGDTEDAGESGKPDTADAAGDSDSGPASGDGAESDPSGSDMDPDEGGEVDEPSQEAGEEAGDRADGGEKSDELGGDSEQARDSDSDEDAPEAGEEAGITGTGDIEGGALDEGSGGGQAAESSREDRQREDDSADDSAEGDDLGSDSEPGSDSEDEGGSPLDGDRDAPDESADAGSSGPAPTDDDTDGDAADVSPGNGSVHDEEGDAEPFDSGADDGTGGIDLIENKELDDIPLGTPEEVEWALLKLGDHEDKPTSVEEQQAEQAVDRAIIQGLYFETPSRYIYGVREHRYGEPVIVDGYNTSQAWDTSGSAYLAMGFRRHQLGRDGEIAPQESVLGAALVRMRVAFSDNKRGHNERNLKSGKINSKALGKRAWNNDERLFRRKTQPGKKDYYVILGMDVSGSTVGRNILLEKQAVMAQAELCKRMGIKFSIFAHSGNLHSPGSGRSAGMDLDVYLVKEHNEPWDDKIKARLKELGPDSSNLDGHFLEYLRKAAERVPATDKVILYYSDGKMPAENHDEELEILQREIRYCSQRDITLLGVGIRTDSPARHGLDTVQVDTDEDIVKVVRHLEKRLH